MRVPARLSRLLPLALLPVALFLALFHPAILDIGNFGWLIRGTDNGENALGLHAYLHDSGAGLSLRTTLLGAPEGVPLLFTDSNPLLGLLLKPFAALLPADAQFVGVWLLACLFLQVAFAWALLRRFAPSPLALWCGVVLLAALPTLANRFVHVNLMAHWLILWALWVYLDPARAARLRWWAPVIAVTALVHSYLLVMVGAIWASALLERFVAGDASARRRLAGQGVAVLAGVFCLAWWLGAGGRYALSGTYGAFAMPLDALWNAANPSYSNLLPTVAQREGRGFEGFQYLGAGGLLLLIGAVLVARRIPPAGKERAILHRLRWLAPALVVLTLLAVGNLPDIAGHRLPRFPLPEALAPALDAVRASGRLFWPVAYVLMFVALVALYRLPRDRAGLALAALVAVQAIDLAGMFAAIRATSAEAADRRRYVRTADPRWDALVAGARDIAFMPGDVTKDLALFQEVAWRAASRGRPVRTVYAARTALATARRLAAEQQDFAAGRLVPGRLYVLLPASPLPAEATPHMLLVDGVVVIRPVASSPRSVS